MPALSMCTLFRRAGRTLLSAALLLLPVSPVSAQNQEVPAPARAAEGGLDSVPADSGEIPPAVTDYKGRKVAQTMHWAGAEWLLRANREQEENAALMLKELQIKPGWTVCDLGCGNGYHALTMARMTGNTGKVLAVDIQQEMIDMLNARTSQRGITNIQAIHSEVHDPKLPPASCDLILLVDVYHEFSHPEHMLRAMHRALKPGGVVALVEFRAEDDTVPIKPEHKMTKEQIKKEWLPMGFAVEREYDGLPWQHLIFLRRSEDPPGAPAFPEIIAHRGASHDAPENTLAALKLGWEQGADADELDIYLSKDNEVVVIHDKTTKRTAGADRPVAEQTLAELRALDAGAWKAPRFAGERIPTLKEALALIPVGKRLFIEIKCGPEVLPFLREVLDQSKVPARQLAIICFQEATLKAARPLFPELPLYWLVGWPKDKPDAPAVAKPKLADLIATAKRHGFNGLNLQAGFPIDRAFADEVNAAGLKLYTWTVNDADKARKLAAAGVEGITTDRPEWLRDSIKTTEKAPASD